MSRSGDFSGDDGQINRLLYPLIAHACGVIISHDCLSLQSNVANCACVDGTPYTKNIRGPCTLILSLLSDYLIMLISLLLLLNLANFIIIIEFSNRNVGPAG